MVHVVRSLKSWRGRFGLNYCFAKKYLVCVCLAGPSPWATVAVVGGCAVAHKCNYVVLTDVQ